tara:strand:- start:1965 stop:2156 length:192 start_codon:yes stop_codon:yes gene_type:complete
MAVKNSVPIRVDPSMKKLLDDIKIAKIKNGTTNKLLSDRRLTLAMTRIPEVKEKLLRSNILDD